MGKAAVIIAALFLLTACASPSGDAERYLRAHYPASTIVVHSASEPRSLYSPFEALNSLRLQSDHDAAYYETYAETARALQDLVRFSDEHPDLCNRTGFSAFVSIGGRDKTVVFFYERDGRTIGHTSLELLDSFMKLSYGH